jgi:hypothetical protein
MLTVLLYLNAVLQFFLTGNTWHETCLIFMLYNFILMFNIKTFRFIYHTSKNNLNNKTKKNNSNHTFCFKYKTQNRNLLFIDVKKPSLIRNENYFYFQIYEASIKYLMYVFSFYTFRNLNQNISHRNWRTSFWVKLGWPRRPKIICSPSYADIRSRANTTRGLDFDHMIKREHTREVWG